MQYMFFLFGVCMRIKGLLIAVTIVVAIFVSMTDKCEAQRVMKNYNEAITANPLALAFGIFNLNYEMQVSQENSLVLGASYYHYSGWTGFSLSGMYKWYLFQEKDKAIKGFGFGPSLSLGHMGYRDETYDNGLTFAIGGEANYKFIFDDFVLEPVFGANFNVLSRNGLNWQPFYLGVNVGYAW